MSKKEEFDDAIGSNLLGEKLAKGKVMLKSAKERREREEEAKKQNSIIKQLEIANEMMKMELAAMEEESSGKVGRPAKNHGRKRTSVIVAPELWNEFKILSMKHGSSVSDFLEIAINDALEKYEK